MAEHVEVVTDGHLGSDQMRWPTNARLLDSSDRRRCRSRDLDVTIDRVKLDGVQHVGEMRRALARQLPALEACYRSVVELFPVSPRLVSIRAARVRDALSIIGGDDDREAGCVREVVSTLRFPPDPLVDVAIVEILIRFTPPSSGCYTASEPLRLRHTPVAGRRHRPARTST